MILDEGTANLDEQNEALIADLIDQMPSTHIVVAHRPALLRRAKRVFTVGARKLVAAERGALERTPDACAGHGAHRSARLLISPAFGGY